MKRETLLPLLGLALLLLLLAAYSNHFHNPFEFDDSHTIETNSAIRELRNIPRFFTDSSTFSSQVGSDYRPVVTTLNAIDFALAGGLDPFTFHRSIFVSYLILGLVLYLLYARIGEISSDWPWVKVLALCATGWFMLHTANAETINYIIQRGDSFSTLMVVLGLVVYMYRPGWRRYGVYLIPMVIGFLTKTPALMFVPLLFFYSLLFERNPGLTARVRESRWPKVVRSLTDAVPAFLVAIGLVLLSNAMSSAYRWLAGQPGSNYAITQPFVYVHYFDNFLLPLQFSVDTDWQLLASPIDDRFFAGVAFILLMLGIATYAARRTESRPITFGILWFFIALAPTSSFIPLTEVLNDHRPFFPYIGLVLAFSWAIGLLIRKYEARIARSRVLQLLLVLLVAVLWIGNAAGVYQRNRVWSSGESLWHEATVNSPNNPRAWMNYGLTQMAKGEYDATLDAYNRALSLAPSYPILHINLGILYGAMNRPAEAENYFKRALQLDPNTPPSYYYYARWLYQQGRDDEARALVAQALALSPRDSGAQELAALLAAPKPYEEYINDSLTFYNAGDYRKSVEAAQSALQLQPDSAVAYNNICSAYNELNEWDKAIEACQQALAIRADFELAKNNLESAIAASQAETKSYEEHINDSLAFFNAGNYERSLEAAQSALRLQPASAIAHNNICSAYNALQRWEQAIEACEKALAIAPDFELAKNNLAVALQGKQ